MEPFPIASGNILQRRNLSNPSIRLPAKAPEILVAVKSDLVLGAVLFDLNRGVPFGGLGGHESSSGRAGNIRLELQVWPGRDILDVFQIHPMTDWLQLVNRLPGLSQFLA